jgi:hypothetical protein
MSRASAVNFLRAACDVHGRISPCVDSRTQRNTSGKKGCLEGDCGWRVLIDG